MSATNAGPVTRIALADDHPLVRAGIRATLLEDPSFETVGEASTGDDALKMVLEKAPDLLILDLSMPGLAPDQVVARSLAALPNLKTLILTAYDDDVYVRRMSQVLISGYLLKDEAPANLLHAIRAILSGAVWFSQTVARKMMTQDKDLSLTGRERDLLECIAKGLDNKAISEELHLAEQTVRNYTSTLYQKLGVSSRTEAVVWSHQRGIGL